MGKIAMKAPIYGLGEVISLSHDDMPDKMPERICIQGIRAKIGATGWTYDTTCESTGYTGEYDESFINNSKSNIWAPVYKLPAVVERMSYGYRWAGNYCKEDAMTRGTLIAGKSNVKNVRLYPALNGSGGSVKPHYGIWVRYNTIMDDEGKITKVVERQGGAIVIK